MRTPNILARLAMTASLLAVGAAVLVGMAQPASLTPEGITEKTLLASGVELRSPTVQSAAISMAEAQQAVLATEGSGATIRQAFLADATFTFAVPVSTCICWVVSLSPPGGIQANPASNTQPLAGTFFLDFIDASTGKFVLGVDGGTVP